VIRRIVFSLLTVAAAIYLITALNILWDPVFVLIVFLTFYTGSLVYPVIGVILCLAFDSLMADSVGLFTISGFIIFGCTLWLSHSYPLARKPLSVIMIPVYSQFLWFMLLFGYYISEGRGALHVGYIAPFMLGNLIIATCLAIVFFGFLTRDRKRDFHPSLFSGKN